MGLSCSGFINKQEYQVVLEWLVNERLLAGMSQQDLAKELNKPQSYISKFENGERRLDIIEVIDICNAIKCNPFDLLKLITQRNR